MFCLPNILDMFVLEVFSIVKLACYQTIKLHNHSRPLHAVACNQIARNEDPKVECEFVTALQTLRIIVAI